MAAATARLRPTVVIDVSMLLLATHGNEKHKVCSRNTLVSRKKEKRRTEAKDELSKAPWPWRIP